MSAQAIRELNRAPPLQYITGHSAHAAVCFQAVVPPRTWRFVNVSMNYVKQYLPGNLKRQKIAGSCHFERFNNFCCIYSINSILLNKKAKSSALRSLETPALDKKTNRIYHKYLLLASYYNEEIRIGTESKQKDGNAARPSLHLYVFTYLSICFQRQHIFID